MALLIPSLEVSSVTGHRCQPQRLATLKRVNGHVRVRVHCSMVMDMEEARVVKLGKNVKLYGQFSGPVRPNTASSCSKEEEEKRNYYVNTGDAIRTLREEFPGLFYKELTFDIYRDDIVFKDPINTFVGIDNYKTIFWALQFHGRIFFRALSVDIVSVWQPVENMIMVRWTAHGMPRVPWESWGRFDGTSEYKLDKNGKIYEHRVHNIALNAPPKFRAITVQELIQVIGCPSTPKPTYFEIASSSIWGSLKMIKLAGLRHRLGLLFNFTQRPKVESSGRS